MRDAEQDSLDVGAGTPCLQDCQGLLLSLFRGADGKQSPRLFPDSHLKLLAVLLLPSEDGLHTQIETKCASSPSFCALQP